MGTLLLFIAIVIGTATFIENDFGTEAARALVYDTLWFELAFFILAVNLFGNLINFRLWNLKRLPVLGFHLAFLLILLGAAVTRYFGYEGIMHIREGETSNTILSREQFVEVVVKSCDWEKSDMQPVHYSVVSPDEYSKTFTTPVGKFTVRSTAFVHNAMMHTVPAKSGTPAVLLSVSGISGMEEKTLMQGGTVTTGNVVIGFDPKNRRREDFFITTKNGEPAFITDDTVKTFSMRTGKQALFVPGVLHPFLPGLVYSYRGIRLVLQRYFQHAAVMPVPSGGKGNISLPDAIKFEFSSGEVKKELFVFGRKEAVGQIFKTTFKGAEIAIRYGSKKMVLPFALQLNDFILERYPGSNSPSSYVSEVTLIDERHNLKEEKRIFMNNIMKYEGYRFFQASYDPDEKGTILSVNRDVWGTFLTYLGYFLLTIGMAAALIFPKTRFRYLLNKTKRISNKKRELAGTMLLLISLSAVASDMKPLHPVSKKTASDFGNLWVQDNGGRIKPLNTLNSEVCRKLVKHNSFKGLSADQVMLGILLDPGYWQKVPMITVKNRELKKTIGINGRKASFSQFFTTDGRYKIAGIVEDAIRKDPSQRDKFEQEAIKIDEQVNIFYMATTGALLRIFPDPGDIHSSWSTPNATVAGLLNGDRLKARNSFYEYLTAVKQNDLQGAEKKLFDIEEYQRKFAGGILPSETKKRIEIFYNKTGIFMVLFPVFFVLGLILLVFQFITLFKPGLQFRVVMKSGFVLILAGFVAYSAGLILRAYISGHAPWSNGYESMLYIGWVTILAGLVFYNRSGISLAVSSLFGGIVLMVAHLSWMNPEITNLVPVLKSYWLTIHVAVITASYGFLSLGALLGFLNLLLIGLRTSKNRESMMLTIEELTAINELSLTIGLYLLTIGSFLGGVWANESWGRYWGWDPKETWSAVTILVYAFVLHMRLIPGMKDIVIFNFAALMGFGSVLMTYLGVNYYLAGLHSYAKGEPVPLPAFVYYSAAVIIVVSALAFLNDHMEKSRESEKG